MVLRASRRFASRCRADGALEEEGTRGGVRAKRRVHYLRKWYSYVVYNLRVLKRKAVHASVQVRAEVGA